MKFKYIKVPLMIINILISICLLIKIENLDVLPTKYFLLISSVIVAINIITIILLSLKNTISRIIAIILSVILIIISIIGLSYIKDTNDFLNNSFNNNRVETSTYNVIVLKDSSVSEIKDLEGKKIGYLKDNIESLNQLKEQITPIEKEYEDLFELYDNLLNKNLAAILIDEAYLDVLSDDNQDLDKRVKVLYSFSLETKLEGNNTHETKVKPLNIYISGSDSRSNNISNKSRSDVNMIVTINPNTHQILLTSIPRDYYVQVHGQTGLKDKLTHSGIYGLEKSTQTVEDLFDIKIDYSIKIGMNAVVEVVDTVGGIEVYSDRTFNSYHIPGWVVKKGVNNFDGKQALAYARERYAYASGDRHRIQNQQQVLEVVLKKVLSSKKLLLKYDEILTSLGNLYRTDIPREVITTYVKQQLDTMQEWTFESQWVDGKGASLNTHTAPKYKRYVMIPNEEDLKKAREKINNIINNK